MAILCLEGEVGTMGPGQALRTYQYNAVTPVYLLMTLQLAISLRPLPHTHPEGQSDLFQFGVVT